MQYKLLSYKSSLSLAIIISRRDTKLVAVVLVDVNTVIHLPSVATITLNAIYGTYCCTKALANNTMDIIRPKPQSRLEGNDNVIGDGLGRVETVKTKSLTSKGVVVVPGDLKWTTTIVLLTRCAWILWVTRVTVRV
ncbi:hypothetical protein M5K25_013300 [Dendrobium thyrsiflorum]|uniref:Uncharacterized protein n=1 Tax=Dendrobium thyrsiflorum TaxID=117978 RepID=A0ABD0UT92_DENTH